MGQGLRTGLPPPRGRAVPMSPSCGACPVSPSPQGAGTEGYPHGTATGKLPQCGQAPMGRRKPRWPCHHPARGPCFVSFWGFPSRQATKTQSWGAPRDAGSLVGQGPATSLCGMGPGGGPGCWGPRGHAHLAGLTHFGRSAGPRARAVGNCPAAAVLFQSRLQ